MILDLENEKTFGVSFQDFKQAGDQSNITTHNIPEDNRQFHIGQAIALPIQEALKKSFQLIKDDIESIGFNIDNLCFIGSIMFFDKSTIENASRMEMNPVWAEIMFEKKTE